jgi:hypothetical protein
MGLLKSSRSIWAVIAIGFLAVSCGGGGGNIKKVQNGVFNNYDNTITVGKAIENNRILKSGKWKAVEMNGRNYVTYTAKLTRLQAEELIMESSTLASYKNKPNYGTALAFYRTLIAWTYASSNADALAKLTSMSAEEINQAIDIIRPDVTQPRQSDYKNWSEHENAVKEWMERHENDIEKILTIDGYEMTLSFVMNQDDTFSLNMLENETEVTLNCFNNLKVRFKAGDIEDDQSILKFIYSPSAPKFF